MKSEEIQKLKPVYIHEASYATNDEFSLLDFILVLVRYWKTMAAIFISFVSIGVIAALQIPPKYTYTTTIEIGGQIIDGSFEPIESPQSLLAKIEYSFIPHISNEFKKSAQYDKYNYRISAIAPKNTSIIILKSTGTKNQGDTIISLMQGVVQHATQDHKIIFEAVKQNLTTLQSQAAAELAALDAKEIVLAGEKRILETRRDVYESQLANLRATRQILPAMITSQSAGTSRKLIVVIATLTGFFLAIFVLLIIELFKKVRDKIQANDSA